MEQAESNPDSPRAFTTEKWFVQLDMAARGIACSSKRGTSGGTVMQARAFEVPVCSRATRNLAAAPSQVPDCRQSVQNQCSLRATSHLWGPWGGLFLSSF